MPGKCIGLKIKLCEFDSIDAITTDQITEKNREKSIEILFRVGLWKFVTWQATWPWMNVWMAKCIATYATTSLQFWFIYSIDIIFTGRWCLKFFFWQWSTSQRWFTCCYFSSYHRIQIKLAWGNKFTCKMQVSKRFIFTPFLCYTCNTKSTDIVRRRSWSGCFKPCYMFMFLAKTEWCRCWFWWNDDFFIS